MIGLYTALIAPYFIDWGFYEEDFERETSRIIGQKVEVTGDTKVRLLPIPSITFGGLAIGKNPDNTPMMTVDQFAMDIELMPLLKGVAKIVQLKLVRPKLNLHVNESGAIAWTDRQKISVDPEQIKLENFTISNGEINVHGLTGGRTLSLEQLDGRISAKSLFGPWRIDVGGYVENKRVRLDLDTGHLQDDGSIRIKLSANRVDLPYRLSLDGPVQFSEGLLRWNGEYKLDVPDDDAGNASRHLPIFSQGDFDFTPHRIDVPQFRLEVGDREDPYTINGTGFVNISDDIKFNIKADGRQIDLDRIGKNDGAESRNGGLDLEQRLGVMRSIIEKIPVPPAQGIIDLALPAIVAGDTLIRDVTAKISPDFDGWNIQHLGATLPGNTKFEANGKVGLGQDFGFSGHMLVASNQPTGLATWLGKRNNPFIRKLHSAGFAADVVISDNQTSLDNLELVLDAAILRGKLQRLASKNGRAAVVIGLEGEQINLDDLRAIFSLIAEDDSNAIANHDLDISLKAGKLNGFDITAENVEARFRIFGGSVSVEKLNASNFFGASLASSGRIDNLLNRPNGQFNLAIKAEKPARLLAFIQSQLPENEYIRNLAQSPALAENLDLEFVINARSSSDKQINGSKGQAFIHGEMGGTQIEIETEFQGLIGELSALNMDVIQTLENADPATLLMQLNLPVLSVDVSGPLKITGTFGGDPRKGFNGYLSAQLSDSKIKTEGMAYLTGKNAGNARFKITQSSQDIVPMLVLAGVGLPSLTFSGEAIPTSFTGSIELKNNKIFLRDGAGQINGREFEIDLEFTKNATSNHHVTGQVTATSIDLSLLAGIAFTSRGSDGIEPVNGWNETNFSQAVLRGLDGEIDLKVGSSDFGLGDTAKNIAGELALVDGSINLNGIKGTWLNGVFNANLSLTNAEGIGTLSTQFRFEGIDASSVSKALNTAEFVTGEVDILGDLEGSGRSPAAIVSSLTGSGTIDLEDIMISGINTSPLKHVFEAADQEKFEILDENVLPVITQVIDDGSVEIPVVSIPYVVAVGKLRARNISIDAVETDMVAAVEFDIKNSNVKSELSVLFDPGIEWVDGADPQIVMSWNGDIKTPERSIDVQPLSGFLSLRNFEREQRRVDLLQASIVEKQRLRRDIIITNARMRYRQRLREEELRRQRQAFLAREETMLREQAAERHYRLLVLERIEREERIRREEEAERLRLEEEARIKAEKERLEEEARVAAQEEKKRLEEAAAIAAKAKQSSIEAELLRLLDEASRDEEARKIQKQLDLGKPDEFDIAPKPVQPKKVKKPRISVGRVKRTFRQWEPVFESP